MKTYLVDSRDKIHDCYLLVCRDKFLKDRGRTSHFLPLPNTIQEDKQDRSDPCWSIHLYHTSGKLPKSYLQSGD